MKMIKCELKLEDKQRCLLLIPDITYITILMFIILCMYLIYTPFKSSIKCHIYHIPYRYIYS